MIRSTKINIFLTLVGLTALMVGGLVLHNGLVKERQVDTIRLKDKVVRYEGKTTAFQRQRPVYSSAETAIDRFMNGFLTFSDQKEFDNRRETVKSLVTQAVDNDKLLFKVDKYHKITQLSLQGNYVKSAVIPTKLVNNQLTASVYATQTLNFKDKQGKDAVKAFTVTYDGNTGKLTKVTSEGNYEVNTDSSVF
ncbi:hypothetical protein EFL69_06550 [Weissella confusa]|uniref:hypothetical protein n=1 Tax=Weissella confusa TaxID=1583 RepID=UPI00223BC1E5|nr:hypothetical protein [Weissella confusa]MCS9992739.1 hypothetical protein [Weissella confusa]